MILTVTPNPSLDRTLEVPSFAAGGTYRADLLAVRPAGKGLNVARCLKELGAEGRAAGIVGRGSLRRFAASLLEQGVECAFVESACEVRQSTTVIDPNSAHETHLRERGGPVAPAEIDALVGLVSEHASRGGWVAVCGSLPDGMDARGLAKVIEAARECGARVALDSSGEGLSAARLAKVDLVKPNAAELEQLAGRKIAGAADAVEAAREVSGELGATLLVTLGAEGALLIESFGRRVSLRARCDPEGFVSSVGAGDAALAGYLFAASMDRSPEDRLRFAVAAGTASISEPVAGALDAGRFRRLAERVEVNHGRLHDIYRQGAKSAKDAKDAKDDQRRPNEGSS